ncbi:MAG: DNRLRE domain-containing protein, partial [Clostridia bacterium]|nr:DNRLRE domain-containing protein [Clostridia bacterium]
MSEDVLLALADKDDEKEADAEEAPDITGEETDLRDAGVKHFRLSDGRYMAAIYPEPVHYEKDGEWVDIDNTLREEKVEDGTVRYAATETSTPVSFPDRLVRNDGTEAPITVSVRGHELKMTAESADPTTDSVASVVEPSKLTSAMLEPTASEGAEAESLAPKSKLADWLSSRFGKEKKEDGAEVSEKASPMAVDNKDSAITYKNALSGADLEYKVTSSQVKEAIVLKEKQEDYRFAFSFDAGDLEVIENGDGSVSLIENGDEDHPLFVFAAPFMQDTNGECSEDVFMTVEKADPNDKTSGLYNLIVKADPAWINDSARAFPVIIDPTVLLDVGYLNIDDTYVDTASATHHAWAGSLYVGKNSLGTTRTYIKYALPDLPDCSVVVGSKLYLAQRDYDPGSGTKAFIAAYAPNANWTNTTLLWSNQPAYDATYGAVDFTTFTAGTGTFNYTLDITKIAKKWYEQGQNYGVMLKSYNESTTRRSAFYSTNYTSAAMYPQCSVTYVNSTGLESYWNYETVDLGRSGTVSVNDYNGAMTYVVDDIDLSGNTSPMSMSHIYLSDVGSLNEFSDLQTTRYGAGFRTSLMERIKLLSSTADPALYTAGYRVKLTDVDGTVHYFKKTDTVKHYVYEFDENVVIDEAPANDYIFTLSYEDGSKRLYDSEGYIVGMLDQNGVRYTITPASGNQMSITDGANRTGTLQFNASGYLTSFTDPTGRVTSYTYSGDKLTTITYPDSRTTQYTYNSNGLLESITATDGTSVRFAYKAVTSKGKTFYRVATMTRKGTNSDFNTLSFQYEGGFTVVTSGDGTVNKISFDSMGRAIGIQDQDGNLVTGKYNNGGNKQNTVASESNSFSVTENFFLNHSFEEGETNWNLYVYQDGYNLGVSTEAAKAGSQSIKLSRTAAGGDYLNQDYTNVSAGETYVASAYMKIDGQIENGNAFLKTEIKQGDTILSTEYSIPYYTTQGEWQRVQVPVTVPSGCDRIRVFATLETNGPETETVYFDCMQLEKKEAAGPYNFLTNPTCDMLDSSGNAIGWTLPTGGSTETFSGSNKWIRIAGAPASNRNAYQTISLSGDEGAVLVFGGTALGFSSAQCNDTENNSRRFGLKLYLYNNDTLVTSKSLWFNTYTKEVQGISGSIKATGAFNKVLFRCLYNQEVNYANFDDLYVYEDNYGTNYSYDSDGRLILQKSDSGDAIRYTYNGPDITKIAFEKNGTEKDNETYTYDNNHNILTSTTKDGIVTSYTYPSTNRGMPTRITVTDESGTLSSRVDYTYTAYDNYLATTTDENGEVTTYNYNTTKGLLNSVTDPLGNVTSYTYNANNDEPLSTSGSIDANHDATV